MGVWTDRVVPRLADRSLPHPALDEFRASAWAYLLAARSRS
jgi:hypothetical protein